MFLSKGYSFASPMRKLLCENLIPLRLSSTAVETATLPTEKPPVPDKLYTKVDIELRSNDPAVMKSYGIFATTAAQHLGITVEKNFAPKKAHHERFTLLKCVHIQKKHRVQYETRTYFRYLSFLRLTGSTADTYLEYLQRNLPEGVAMKVTKVEVQKLPELVTAPQV